MTTYLIIGKTGQLGQAFARRLGSAAVAVSRTECDLAEPGAVTRLVAEFRPRVVLNCAAWNYVDRAEHEPHPAFAVNAFAVRDLAQACRQVGACVVHFSTDYVFGLDEARRVPYGESSMPGPVNVYGVSKLAGEYFLRAIAPRHLIVRTCGLYGVPGTGGKQDNFVEKILRQATTGQPVSVVADQVCSPTYVPDLVTAVLQCLDRNLTGLIHLVNGGETSWYKFACAIVKLARLDTKVVPISSADSQTLARRPKYSALISENPQVPKLRPWYEALEDYLSQRQNA